MKSAYTLHLELSPKSIEFKNSARRQIFCPNPFQAENPIQAENIARAKVQVCIYIYPEPDRPLNLGTQKIIHPWIQKIIFWVKNRILGKRSYFVKGCFLIIPKIHVDGNPRLNPPKWIIRYDKLRLILGCPSQQGFHNLFPAATGSERFFFRQHRVRSGYGGLGLGARVEIKLGKPE